jgi:hypothetical protein
MFRNLLIAFVLAAFALPALAQNNTAPKPNIVGQNGLPAPQVLSTDPQISTCVFDGTGVTVTSATQAVFADATHFPCTSLRGAGKPTSASGFQGIARNGLYKVAFQVNCTGVTTETGIITAQISTDGGSTFTSINGASGRSKFLTGILQVNIAGSGYVSVSQTSTNLLANNVVVQLTGSSSGGSAMTCANGGGFSVERVDQLQPATYP